MPLKLFNKKPNGNQHTVKLKIDLISNVSYAYPKDTVFEIEWKRGTNHGVLPNVFMQSDGEIKPTTQFLIPCQFVKQKNEQGIEEFAPKSLIINLRKVEPKKKSSTKIGTLQIDLSHMANKFEADKEKQYSSTMKGVVDQEFKPYVEFTTSIYKGLMTPDDFGDKSLFIAPIVSPPQIADDISITHSLYSENRRNSVSSISSELSEYSNIQETNNQHGSHRRNNSSSANSNNEIESSGGSDSNKKTSPNNNNGRERSSSDPFDFKFESSKPTTFSKKTLINSITLDEPISSPSEAPIFSSDEELNNINRSPVSDGSSGSNSNRSISPANSTQSFETFEKDTNDHITFEHSPNRNNSSSKSNSRSQTPTKGKKFFSFASKKKIKSPETAKQSRRKNSISIGSGNKPENANLSKIKGDEVDEFLDDSELTGSGKWKRRHSTPNVGFFSIKSFKDKEKQKEKEKEKEKNNHNSNNDLNMDNFTINETNEQPSVNSNSNGSSLKSTTSPQNKSEKRKNSKEKTFMNKLTTSFVSSSNSGNGSNGDPKDTLQSSLISRNIDEKMKFLNDDMIVSKRPEYVGNIPISAIAIYKCLFEWKELSPQNQKCLLQIIETFETMIRKKNMGKEKSFYWLSSCFSLGFLLEKSFENLKISNSEKQALLSITVTPNQQINLSGSENQNLRIFTGLVQKYQKAFWSLYWDSLKIELTKVMDRVVEQLSEKEFETSPIFLNFLLSTLEFLEKRLPFQSIWPNIFKQIFFYVGGYLINKFLTDNSFSTTNNAVNTKLFISSLSQWFQENKELNYFYYFKMEMSTLIQILDVLMIEKESLLDESIRKEICPSLTTTQLAIVLCRFNPENNNEEVDPAVIKFLQDEGIKKHDIQNITTNVDKLFDLPDKPEPSRSIIDTKIPVNIFPQSNQKLFKFLIKPTTIY